MKVPLSPCGDCDHPAVYLSLSLCQQMTKSFHGGRLQEPRGCFLRSTELCLINGRSIEMPPPWALEHREQFHTFPKVQEAGRSEESTSFPGAGEGGWQQAGTLINRNSSLATEEVPPLPTCSLHHTQGPRPGWRAENLHSYWMNGF